MSHRILKSGSAQDSLGGAGSSVMVPQILQTDSMLLTWGRIQITG